MPLFFQPPAPAQRAALAAWLIVLTATFAVRFPLKSLAQLRETGDRDQITAGMSRFAALKPYLRPSDSIGYLRGPSADASRQPPEDGRRALAQNALLPHIVERSTGAALVIFDSDDPQAEPAQARREGWSLVVDAGNGLRLYRTSGGR